MNENIWDIDLEEIEPKELTEEEKQLAKATAEIELEYLDAISMINTETIK